MQIAILPYLCPQIINEHIAEVGFLFSTAVKVYFTLFWILDQIISAPFKKSSILKISQTWTGFSCSKCSTV